MMPVPPDYIRWYPGAIALATNLLSSQGQAKERAKDIVQQAVAKLLGQGPHPGAHRQAWFFTVVRNACIDEIRQQGKYVANEAHISECIADTGPADHVIAEERQQQIRQALQTLSFEQREIILLRDVNDLSYADIAQVLAINMGTVMSRIHRARMALRSALSTESTSREPTPTKATSNTPRSLPKEAL